MQTQQPDHSSSEQPYTVAFLLLPGFTMTAVTGAIDVLRLANRELEREAYRWQLVTQTNDTVHGSTGLSLSPVITPEVLLSMPRTGLLMVCGGEKMVTVATPALLDCLQLLSRHCDALGAMCTGSYPLARAGLLDGYRATIHWEILPAVIEEISTVAFGERVFVIDRDRLTCAGGTGSLDLMLAMLGARHGHDLAARISEQLIVAQLRSDHDQQTVPLYAHLGRFHSKLIEAATVMHANLEEPLSVDEVGVAAGVSRRQLERLFKRHVGQAPTRYYLQMRLRRARQLLMQTGMSVTEIAIACGFRSSPHFSKAYRSHFGQTPTAQRRPAQDAWQNKLDVQVQEQLLGEPDAMQVSEDLATALASPDSAETSPPDTTE